MQIVYESLPSLSVDLDKETVYVLDNEEEDLAIPLMNCEEAGRVGYVDQSGVTTWIHWGRTTPNRFGHSDVLVDIPKIELSHLQCLWIAGVITGDYPMKGSCKHVDL